MLACGDFQTGDIHVNCVLCGDVKSPITLSNSNDRPCAPLGLDMPLVPIIPSWTVCDYLLKKHPMFSMLTSLISLEGCNDRFCPVIFEGLDA